MSKSKIDEMRSMVRRAEKAEAKLTKREIENIENGRRAREVLRIIEARTDNVISTIAEAYSIAPSNEVDVMLNAFMEDLRQVIDKNTEENATVSKPRRERKIARSEEKREMSEEHQEDNYEQSAPENVKPVVSSPIQNTNNFQFDLDAGFDPGNAIKAGGILYDTQ